MLQADCCCDYVDDRIGRSNLMKVNGFHCCAMNLRFRHGDCLEHVDRATGNASRVVCRIDYRCDVGEVTCVVGFASNRHRCFCAGDTHLGFGRDLQFELISDVELCQLSAEIIRWNADIEHCADVHITGDSAETVINQNVARH